MSLKIRLTRGGAKKRPYYRIVVADARSPRDGRFIDKVGTYDPMKPKDDATRITLDNDKITAWLAKGAQPTDRVAPLPRCRRPPEAQRPQQPRRRRFPARRPRSVRTRRPRPPPPLLRRLKATRRKADEAGAPPSRSASSLPLAGKGRGGVPAPVRGRAPPPHPPPFFQLLPHPKGRRDARLRSATSFSWASSAARMASRAKCG